MRLVRWREVFVLVAFAIGCTSRPPAAPETPGNPTAPTTPVQAPAPSGGAPSVNPALRPLVDVAIADLARRLAIGPEAITVIEARAMVWPDGGLGCPMPGMVYPQVQQEGALLRLRAQGREFVYHSGGSRPPFLCER